MESVQKIIQERKVLTRPIGTVSLMEMDEEEEIYFGRNKYTGQLHKTERVPHGHGKMLFENGDEYVGKFKYGKPNGVGSMMYFDGRVYQGIFKKGMRDGQGRLEEPGNGVYKGKFKDDKKHGEGVFESERGDVQTGIWENDKFIV